MAGAQFGFDGKSTVEASRERMLHLDLVEVWSWVDWWSLYFVYVNGNIYYIKQAIPRISQKRISLLGQICSNSVRYILKENSVTAYRPYINQRKIHTQQT